AAGVAPEENRVGVSAPAVQRRDDARQAIAADDPNLRVEPARADLRIVAQNLRPPRIAPATGAVADREPRTRDAIPSSWAAIDAGRWPALVLLRIADVQESVTIEVSQLDR